MTAPEVQLVYSISLCLDGRIRLVATIFHATWGVSSGVDLCT